MSKQYAERDLAKTSHSRLNTYLFSPWTKHWQSHL